MGIHVRTRGRTRDYQFLDDGPSKYWWRSYGEVTDLEKPTILLESNGKSWRAYIAGIFSARRDTGERQIQFNLALDGACDDAMARELALDIVAESADGLAGGRGDAIPGTRLDERLTEDDVERMLVTPGEATREEAAEAVRAAYEGASHPDMATNATPGDWAGGAANARARDQFTAVAASLLEGQQGRALLLNRFLSDDYVDQLPELPGSVNVLLARPEQFGRELSELPGKAGPGAALPPEPEPWPPVAPQKPAVPRRRVLALVLVAVVILIAVILWVTRGSSPQPPAKPTPPNSSPTPTSSAQ